MPISDADRAYMEEVAAYFRCTRSDASPEGSIRETAVHFGINRNKVRKILITTGDITSPLTEEAMKLKSQGLSVKAIASRLNVSTATVSIYLPYAGKVKDGLNPSPHTQAVREYRAYEREQAERQIQKKMDTLMADTGKPASDTNWKNEWEKDVQMSYTKAVPRPARKMQRDADEWRESVGDGPSDERSQPAEQGRASEGETPVGLLGAEALDNGQNATLAELTGKPGLYPGALVHRRVEELEAVSGERLPSVPREVRRLRFELVDDLDGDERKVLREYGGLKYGRHITRDVIVPSDIPLYAVHYLIQRLFGWQNSHLHCFELPEEKLMQLTRNRAAVWSQLVGVIFRSPFMEDEDLFWADDYESGSFKNWLTKKYTGPYLSQCWGEGFIACQTDMEEFFGSMQEDREFYVMYWKHNDRVVWIGPLLDDEGRKNEPPALLSGETRLEIMKFSEISTRGIESMMDQRCFDLLERLPLDCVMAEKPEEMTGEEMLFGLARHISRIRREEIHSLEVQPCPQAFTDTIYYHYDFGDKWLVRITVKNDCRDLVEQGRITQEQLDKAQIKCRERYRPVTIAVDGEMLMDDVGGAGGFVRFLKTINPELVGMPAKEKEKARQKKKEMLDWAKHVQNWKKLNPMI